MWSAPPHTHTLGNGQTRVRPLHAEEQTGTPAYRGSLVMKAVTCRLLSSKEETKSECRCLPHSCLFPTCGQIKTQTSASRQHRYLLVFSSRSHRTRLQAVSLATHSCGRQGGLGQTAVIRDGGNVSNGAAMVLSTHNS